jgi:putative phage-type endonuclease
VIQGSVDWFAARRGIVTASKIADVLAKTKSGPAATRTNYLVQLLCERLTGRSEETYTSAAMARGTEMEPLAVSAYEAHTGVLTTECGFYRHPDIAMGASPDRLVGDDGLLECKCPNTATHINTLRTKKPDSRYLWQMVCQMACTDRAWCDFVSFDDRLPEEFQLIVIRIDRDAELEQKMISAVREFNEELDDLYRELLNGR